MKGTMLLAIWLTFCSFSHTLQAAGINLVWREIKATVNGVRAKVVVKVMYKHVVCPPYY
jgi:hypothetical protein